MPDLLRIGALVSGNGTNLQAIIDAIEKKELEAEITVVISNKKTAGALERTKKHGLNGIYLDPGNYENNREYEKEIVRLFGKNRVQWVVLAGYLKIITDELLSAYPDRILNIHPSLLPAFTGLHAQEQALKYGVKITGCTVHLVEAGLDSGPVIIQAAVPVLENDTVETLTERISKKEHQIYPQVLKWISTRRLKIDGRRVSILPSSSPSGNEIINPGGIV
ncbi:MAG: phosphoribosylglycinamide formyltransferase [Nitrospirae bacterium]|nr:phosphoribosylglycinamide formyltransferase [Nitrospirota bacterium]MBI3604946.1 phosphoribosylglycinamide formyltransferase [Nitrospirota bacterium]